MNLNLVIAMMLASVAVTLLFTAPPSIEERKQIEAKAKIEVLNQYAEQARLYIHKYDSLDMEVVKMKNAVDSIIKITPLCIQKEKL